MVEAAARADRNILRIRDEPLIMGVDVARFGDDACSRRPRTSGGRLTRSQNAPAGKSSRFMPTRSAAPRAASAQVPHKPAANVDSTVRRSLILR
jgi:hypothetical protein